MEEEITKLRTALRAEHLSRYRWKDEGMKRLIIRLVEITLEDLQSKTCGSKYWLNVCDYAEAYIFIKTELGDQILDALGLHKLPEFKPCPHVARGGRLSSSDRATPDKLAKAKNILLGEGH